MTSIPDTLPFERWESYENLYDLHALPDPGGYVIVRNSRQDSIVDAPEPFEFDTLSDAYDWLEIEGSSYKDAPNRGVRR